MSLIEMTGLENRVASKVWDAAVDLVGILKARYRRSRQQRIDRLAFQSVLRLDDATLRDIGYSREDVERGDRMPIEVNAALKLQEERVRRS